jgi:hypothetical protein
MFVAVTPLEFRYFDSTYTGVGKDMRVTGVVAWVWHVCVEVLQCLEGG